MRRPILQRAVLYLVLVACAAIGLLDGEQAWGLFFLLIAGGLLSNRL